jgi:hypothetical protein
MTSGLPNGENARVRQLFAEGHLDRGALLEAEGASYHGEGRAPSSARRNLRMDDDPLPAGDLR